MLVYIVAVLCVVGLAIGQILFKLSANSLTITGSYLAPKTAATLLGAMLLYAITSIAWVWVLQRATLGRVYPLMALAFVLVPLISHFVFQERFQVQYFLGVTLICVGIFLAITS